MSLLGNTISIADGDTTPTTADHTDFGSTAVSGGTVVRTFTIENLGDAELNLGGTPLVVIGGTHAADFIVTTLPTTPIAGGGMTTFQIRFDPSGSGLRGATLTIANDDADENPYDFQIQGTGTVTAVPEIAVQGNTVSITDGDSTPTMADHTDFGSTAISSGAVVRTFTIENIGTAALNLGGTLLVAIGGTHAADFNVTTLPTTPIASGGMTTFQVRFDPSGSGLRTATLTIANDDADENPYNFQIQGIGTVTVAPEIDVQGNTLSIADGDTSPATADHTDFGSTAISSGTVVRTFTIANLGNSELILGGTPLVTIGGPQAAEFTVTTLPTTPIASGGMTTFQVRFNPSGGGLRTATLTIANDDADENPYNFQIQGSGTVTSAPEINVQGNTVSITDGDSTPTTVDHTDFGSTAISSGTVVRTFTIENLGDSGLILDGTPLVAIGGTHAADFTVTTLPTTPIASGGMTTFQVTFDPSGNGLRTATLTIANDDADENPYNFQIQGSGTVTSAPEIEVQGNTVSIADGDSTPTTVDHTDFGSTAISGGTVVRTFTVANLGDSGLILGGTPLVVIGGTHAADFTVTTLPTTPIASGGMTTFQVRFDPSGSGLRSATLTIANDDADENPYNFQIQGSGTVTAAPEINVQGNTVSIADGDSTPTTVDHTDFGSTPVSSGIVVRTFTIENVGTAGLNLTGAPRIAIGGTHAADFTVTTLPTMPIASGGMTTFQVRFDPSGSGLRTATLTIANDDADESPYSFQIQGTGTVTSAPEIDVQGNTLSIADGDTSPTTADHTDFGTTAVSSGAVVRTFTIENVGTAALNLTGAPQVAIGGPQAADFTVTTLPAASVASRGMTTFQVRFDPSGSGLRTATLTIANDDTDENPYSFQIQGTGTTTQFLSVSIAAGAISEQGGTTTATVIRNSDTINPLTVTLVSNDTSEATVPATVTIPIGQTTSAPFNITAVNDTIVDGTQTVTITASASGHAAGTDTVDVTDNETAALTLVIAAASISEGAGAGATTATVSRNTPTTNALTVALVSNDTSEATVPTTVTILAGQSISAPFNIAAVNDTIVDGTQTVTITASATNHVSGTDTVDVADNDTAALTLVIATASISEDAGAGATTATVSRNTPTTNALTVTLVSNDTSEATVPATVTILAGQSTSAPFNIAAVNDTIVDGIQTVTITASATGHAAGTDTVEVTDNDTAALTLVIAAASISEGAGAGATTATVSRNTPTTNALTVTLVSNDTSEATVPATVTILVGQSISAPFNITAVNDTIVDGTQTVTITASATDHAAGTDTVDVTDDDTTTLDFGDAPTAVQSGFANDYPVTLAQDGARHTKGSLFLGSLIDVEPDGQPDNTAGRDGSGGDDHSGAADEDGVFGAATIITARGLATRSSFAVTSSGTGKLDAWIDFNQDGDWSDEGEQIFNTMDVAAGLNLLRFSVPAGATSGATGARFRLSSAGGLAPTGAALDGEVEDYFVTILDGDVAGGVAIDIQQPVSGTLNVIADNNDVVVQSGAIELFRAPGSFMSSVGIVGTDGDDILNVANLAAIFAGLVGGDAKGGHDTLRLTGSGQDLDLTIIADSDIQGLEVIDITGAGDNSLKLNVDEVLNISSTTNTLRILHDDGDAVSYGAGWKVEMPQIIASQFVHTLSQDNAIVEVVNTTPFRNPFISLDVNRDGTVAPIDALIIINQLNGSGPGPLATPTSADGLTEFFYFDTNGDRAVAPIDVLVVFNFLNDPTSNAEGESTVVPIIPTFIAAPGSSSIASMTNQERRQHVFSVSPESATIMVRRSAAADPSRSVPERPLISSPTRLTEVEDFPNALDEVFAAWLDERSVLFETP